MAGWIESGRDKLNFGKSFSILGKYFQDDKKISYHHLKIKRACLLKLVFSIAYSNPKFVTSISGESCCLLPKRSNLAITHSARVLFVDGD